MFRIGIVGSDNSHAEMFSKIMNIPDADGNYRFPDMRVTSIYGCDRDRTEQVARDGKIEFFVETPEQMLGSVDAVMIIFRHGDLHKEYALPFIKAGIPTWIDKPFTIRNEDAKELMEAANTYGTLLTGGSTCKYTYDVQMIKNAVEVGSRIGKIKMAVMNFPATLTNDYGGIYFYGAHLAEMAMMAFGYSARSVIASENNGAVSAIVKYDNYQVVLNFIPDSNEYYALLHGEKGTMMREIDITGCYVKGLEKFEFMLKEKKLPLPFNELYAPVELMNAILESSETGDEIYLGY